ncbi:MAG: hypothetical protein WDO12_06695 [Pseudomonadota bacterium]
MSEAEAVSRATIEVAQKTGGVGNTGWACSTTCSATRCADKAVTAKRWRCTRAPSNCCRPPDAGHRNIATGLSNLALLRAEVGDYAMSLQADRYGHRAGE